MRDELIRTLKDSDVTIFIHIGFYYGQTIINGQDIYGNAVNTASRITDLAKENQIFTTKSTVDMPSPGEGISYKYVDQVSIKGNTEKKEIYELIKNSH